MTAWTVQLQSAIASMKFNIVVYDSVVYWPFAFMLNIFPSDLVQNMRSTATNTTITITVTRDATMQTAVGMALIASRIIRHSMPGAS